jgi:hypothetical protein
MTPTQKIKKHLLLRLVNWRNVRLPDLDTGEQIDDAYDMYSDIESDTMHDLRSEVRAGQVQTSLQPYICNARLLRDYDADMVAAQMDDGSWVGWTYWQGGGRHGEPSAIQWMEDAIELSCSEAEQVIIVRTFALK